MAEAVLCEHNNYRGSFRNILTSDPNARYILATYDNTFSGGFNDKTSSCILVANPGERNTLILFEHEKFNANKNGRFTAFNKQHNVENPLKAVPALPNFNDCTSSALLVKHPTKRSVIPNVPDYITKLFLAEHLFVAYMQDVAALPSVDLNNLISSYLESLGNRPSIDDPITFQFIIDRPGFFGEPLMRVRIALKAFVLGYDIYPVIHLYIKFYIAPTFSQEEIYTVQVPIPHRPPDETIPMTRVRIVQVPGPAIAAKIVDSEVENVISPIANLIKNSLSLSSMEAQLNDFLNSINRSARFSSVYLMPGRVGRENVEFIKSRFQNFPLDIGTYDWMNDYSNPPTLTDSDCSIIFQISEIRS